jgi:hypothetical protein
MKPDRTRSSDTAHDRDGLRRLLRGANIWIAAAIDDVDLGFDEFGGMLGKLVEVQAIATLIDPQILPGDEALPFQLVEHGDVMRRAARTEMQAAEPISPPRLLRHRTERPCDTRARKGDELSPPHVVSPCRDVIVPCRLAFFRRA